ncbi:MAG: hypothetical protein ACF8K1_00935 [Phycisphaerales bacterium JB047]
MIWSFLYWLLLSLAVLVGLRALFWDRAGFRGRAKLRCRKCWYDLTGAEGDLREGPIVCPECGKKHASRRAMRKTRRGKRWIALALVLWMGAYTAGVWPRVSRYNYSNGVLGAVPTPVLVLGLFVLPDEPESVIESNGMPYPQRPMIERIAHQIKIRLYKEEETSRLDHWLFYQIARRQTSRVLTDTSSARGDVLTYVYRAWARQHRLGIDEGHWARSVYWMDLEGPEVLPQMSPVYVRVRAFRRLLDEGYWRVQIHQTLMEPKSNGPPNFGRRLVTIKGHDAYHDGYVRIADYVRWANVFSSDPLEHLSVQGRVYEGDPHADLWWPVADIRDSVTVTIRNLVPGGYEIGTIEGVDYVEDAETLEWIEKAVDVGFWWERRWPKEGDVPLGIKVHVDLEQLQTKIPGFSFGGTVYIVYRVAGRTYSEELVRTEPTWWALRDGVDQSGRRPFRGNGVGIPFVIEHSDLFSGAFGYDESAGIESAWFVIQPNDNVVGAGNYAPLWDLDMLRVVGNTIKVPLSEREIRQLEAACRTMQEFGL